jgi:hypothetical protein
MVFLSPAPAFEKGKKVHKKLDKKTNASSWPPHKPLNIDKSFLSD